MTPLEKMAATIKDASSEYDGALTANSSKHIARVALLALADADFEGPNLLTDEAFKARLRAIAFE
jgi:hypothetical protein